MPPINWSTYGLLNIYFINFPDLQSVTITVDISAKGDPTQSTFSGSYRKSAHNLKKIYVQDILTVVRSSLSSHILSALGCFWKQIRGAGIGSQISPSLSNLAVTILERTWQQIDLETLNQPRFAFFGIRYVDNRFVIATESELHPGFLMLCDLDFYGHPVELEVGDDDLLLGFSIKELFNIDNLTCAKFEIVYQRDRSVSE